MCDARAYVVRNGGEEVVLENVDRVEVEGDQTTLTSIFGDRKILRARLKLFDNSRGKLVFEPIGTRGKP